MAKYIKSKWISEFWMDRPCFKPVLPLAPELTDFADWPTLNDYQTLLQPRGVGIQTLSNKPLQIVSQAPKPKRFEDYYAPRIYLTGEIQTRLENWHDFFQVITWRLFPRSKAVINERHYHAARERFNEGGERGKRSAVENLLSLFDECGAIIVYSDTTLADMLHNYQWKKLFWENSAAFDSRIACFTFGHALYEKYFNPYIGMTANCLLIAQDDGFFKLNLEHQIISIDKALARLLTDASVCNDPKHLQPLPVLGIPGWHPDNHRESFYDNTAYFRPKRKL